MTLYDDMQGLARDLLSNPDFKQGMIRLVVLTPGTGPVDDPGLPTETVYTLPGAVARGVKFKYVAKGLALATDQQVTASIVDGIPIGTDADFIEIDGLRYKIARLDQKPAAGTPVVVTYIVR